MPEHALVTEGSSGGIHKLVTAGPGGEHAFFSSPNLLTLQQYGLEDGTTSGFGDLSTYVILTNSTAHATEGTKCLKYQPSAGASGSWNTLGYFNVVEGLSYLVCSKVFRDFGLQKIRLGIKWFDADSTLLSTSVSGDMGPTIDNNLTEFSYSCVAPIGIGVDKAQMYFQTAVVGTVTASMYFDQNGVYQTLETTPRFISP